MFLFDPSGASRLIQSDGEDADGRMMSEPSGRQIRSYHRAFHFELMLYTIGNLRPWRPVPARAVLYTALSELVMIAVAHAPAIGGLVSGLGPEAVYGVIPLALGWLLTVARIEGRRFHVAARVWARHVLRGRTLIGGYRAMKPAGKPVAAEARAGGERWSGWRAPVGAAAARPGRVLLRYPCKARVDGPRSDLSVVRSQTSRAAVRPPRKRSLTIADGRERPVHRRSGRHRDGDGPDGGAVAG